VSATQARLAALCAAAGYPPALLNLIAEATFPHHRSGEALSAGQRRQLAEAVEVMVEGGRTAEHIPVLIDEYKQRHGERWRDVFWTRTLRAAAIRAARRRGQQRHTVSEPQTATNGHASTVRAQPARSAPARPA